MLRNCGFQRTYGFCADALEWFFRCLADSQKWLSHREILRLKKQKPPRKGGEMQFSTGVSIPLRTDSSMSLYWPQNQ
jgi:hypothetical protein